MYRGFVGTVLSHFLSLISTLWAIFMLHHNKLPTGGFTAIRLGLFLIAGNSCLALVRYGHSDGYKLRRVHIITFNLSAILSFTLTEVAFLQLNRLPVLWHFVPALNIIPLLCNALAKDYKTKLKPPDVFILINSLFMLIVSIMYDNYYGVALSLSHFFGYFVIGDSGYFLDTEVPSVDAFQYLTCFLVFFMIFTVCY